MAANTNSSGRTAIKWIRDLAKSHYNKQSVCSICGSDENLELHHYHTVSIMIKNYAEEKGVSLDNKESILAWREKFINDNWHEMVVDTVTLCPPHHNLLHKVYGKEPLLSTAAKQSAWVQAKSGSSISASTSGGYSDLCARS